VHLRFFIALRDPDPVAFQNSKEVFQNNKEVFTVTRILPNYFQSELSLGFFLASSYYFAN